MPHSFRESFPKKSLEKYVDTVWFFENFRGTTRSPVVPDWCADIVFDFLKEDIFVVWVMDICDVKIFEWRVSMAWIRFKPWALSYILPIDPPALLNKQRSLRDISARTFDLLCDDRITPENFMEALNSRIDELVFRADFSDRLLEMVEDLRTHGRVTALSEKFHVSQKTVERLFYKRVGIPPKSLLNMLRFYETHKKIGNPRWKNLTKIALSQGYYDQSHFNHEYKKFTGFNPQKMSDFYNPNP